MLTCAITMTHNNEGAPLLSRPLPWGVHFAGTETSNDNGHVEGAIKAGERAANEVLASLAKAKMAAGAGRQP